MERKEVSLTEIKTGSSRWREKDMEEDESILEAEQTNLSLSPQLGKGVMLHLFAEVEHLSFSSLPKTCQPLLPTDRKLPSAELLTHPRSAPNYPIGSTNYRGHANKSQGPLLHSSHFGLLNAIQQCLCRIKKLHVQYICSWNTSASANLEGFCVSTNLSMLKMKILIGLSNSIWKPISNRDHFF